MIKTVDGTPIFHGQRPGKSTGKPATVSRMHNPGAMRMTTLRACLCSYGPKGCVNCGLCGYGMEYIRRMNAKKRGGKETPWKKD